MDTREDLRTELEAMLAAGRELSPDTDRYLAERFLDRLSATATQRKRRRRPPDRKPRGPRRTATALLVAALALAIGTPISLHENQSKSAGSGYPVAAQPRSCSPYSQLLIFHSLKKALLAYQERANPKSYRFFYTTREPNGEIAVKASHSQCH
jgi:hypothetical protein